MRIPRSALAAAALLGIAALAACAGSVTAEIGRVRNTGIGPVLVDARGYTLYVHTEDSPGQSHCTRPCAVLWPPAEPAAGARPVGEFTIIERESGARQWAYKGWPLYRFFLDGRPGATAGDGAADGEWRVARP
jgi:predicted lipoprotein with Yx(FWY)xxD motif